MERRALETVGLLRVLSDMELCAGFCVELGVDRICLDNEDIPGRDCDCCYCFNISDFAKYSL